MKMAGKRPVYKRINGKRVKVGTTKATKAQLTKVKRLAVKTALNRSVIIKRHPFPGIDRVIPFGTSVSGLVSNQTFKIFYPLQLPKSSANSNADDFNNRESNRIYARNCSFQCHIQPRSLTLEPFQIKMMCGYFKGDDNLGTGQLTEAQLKALYPEINNLPYTRNNGQRDFYWKYVKTWTLCPRQLYDGVAEHMPGVMDDQSQVNRALWLPKQINYNFKFNKLFTYESDEGDALNGWMPLIAIQCLPLEGGTAFTRPDLEGDLSAAAGSYPSPTLHCSMVTYFNDCH